MMGGTRPWNISARVGTIAAVVILGSDTAAQAGMPAITLSDMARMRIQTISFFLMGFLVSALVVQCLWNSLKKDLPRVPRLSYRGSLGVVALWGLLFLVVLSMISGARELMTPGAWKKDGLTYKLADARKDAAPLATGREEIRQQSLRRLGIILRDYAQAHDGQFPASTSVPEIPQELWRVPDPSGMLYIYDPGAKQAESPLVYEPDIFHGNRFVLFRNGQVALMDSEQLQRRLDSRAR